MTKKAATVAALFALTTNLFATSHPWVCPDVSTTNPGNVTVISNHQGSSNVTFHNDGTDGTVDIKRYNVHDVLQETVHLPICTDIEMGVGQGDKVVIQDVDAPSGDSDGASGTWTE